MFRVVLVAFLALVLIAIPAQTALAQSQTQPPSNLPKNKGLYITPVRQFINMDAGSTKSATITVGNYTDDPMNIGFSVKQFSVAEYSYDFTFDDAPEEHISFSADSSQLKPGETKTIPYSITLPADSRPGGQYYTLFATGRGESGRAAQQIQASSVIYLTVNGQLTRGGGIETSSISKFNFRPTIGYTLDITNSGNTHYFAYLSAELQGPFTDRSTSSETHLLLPGRTRHFESSIPSPPLPGIYKAVYGYDSEFTEPVTRTSYIVYIPPWALAAVVITVWLVWAVKRRIRHYRRQKAMAPPNRGDEDS